MDDRVDSEADALRPSLRPLWIGLAINVVAAAFFLGIPYARGPERARQTLPRFTRLAACFFDAEAVDRAGLGLPRGDRARYATLVLRGPTDWPGRCRDELAAVPPEESMFLFPSVKNAEAELRAAVELLDREIVALAEARAQGDLRVPDRPMRGMAQVRAALAELGVASGVSSLSADRDAIRLPAEGRRGLPTPSIVPTRISRGGDWAVSVVDGALLADGLDRRTVSHVRVAEGGVEQRLARRPSLLSAMKMGMRPPWLIWSTPTSQCEGEPEGCVRRATGLAAFLQDRQNLEPMAWIGAHPRGRPGSSIRVHGRQAWVVAAAGGGEAEVRRFVLPEPEVRALGEEREVPRVQARGRWDAPIPEGARLRWLEGSAPLVAFAHGRQAGVWRGPPLEGAPADDAGADEAPAQAPSVPEGQDVEGQDVEGQDVEPRPAGAAPGGADRLTRFDGPGGSVRLAACGSTSDGWVAVGSERGIVVHGLASGATRQVALRLIPPEAGRLKLLCRQGGELEVWAASEGALHRARCGPLGCSEPRAVVAEGVSSYDVARLGARTLLAWTEDDEEGAVRLLRLADGAEGGEGEGAQARAEAPFVPAACWRDPTDGLCGQPRLATDGHLVVLVTRQDEDLRVLRSEDGRRWGALQGLEQY